MPISLELLLTGENEFEFTSGDQACLGFGWGQWGVYSAVFRIYYDQQKPHPTGRIISPEPGASVGDSLALEAVASSPNGAISSVDFIGHYEDYDYDYDGDGVWREWQYTYPGGHLRSHLGTSEEAPFRTAWSTAWVPDQDEPMAVMARIRDEKGMVYITEPVQGLTLDRAEHSVRMHKPYHIPAGWISRAGRTLAADVFVPSLDQATDARAVITTWSGAHADDISLNRSTLVPRVGRDHAYSRNSLDVPLGLLRPGTNSFFTFSATTHHGIKVMWPGIVLFVRFDEPLTDMPPPRPGDLRIFTDAFDGPWTAATPEDGSARIEKSAVAFEGSQVLHVTPSQSFFPCWNCLRHNRSRHKVIQRCVSLFIQMRWRSSLSIGSISSSGISRSHC